MRRRSAACCCTTSDGRSFVDVTASSGTGELHKGHGVAFADIDGDGDLDIVFKVGGATPGDAHAFRLFANPGHGRDWLGLDLVGTRTNRAAIGARIAVTVRGAGRRDAHGASHGVSGGSFGASPLQQHIGLGALVAGFRPGRRARRRRDHLAGERDHAAVQRRAAQPDPARARRATIALTSAGRERRASPPDGVTARLAPWRRVHVHVARSGA